MLPSEPAGLALRSFVLRTPGTFQGSTNTAGRRRIHLDRSRAALGSAQGYRRPLPIIFIRTLMLALCKFGWIPSGSSKVAPDVRVLH
jgi:hypothetical protein